MSRGVSHVVSETKTALAELLDDMIAAQVCEQEDWRAESFIDALRNVRHLQRLVQQMEVGSAQDRDFQIMQRIVEVRENPGLRMLRLVPPEPARNMGDDTRS